MSLCHVTSAQPISELATITPRSTASAVVDVVSRFFGRLRCRLSEIFSFNITTNSINQHPLSATAQHQTFSFWRVIFERDFFHSFVSQPFNYSLSSTPELIPHKAWKHFSPFSLLTRTMIFQFFTRRFVSFI